MQTGCRTAHVGSRLKPLIIQEGTAWKASLPAVLGKTRRTDDRGDRGNVGIIRSPIRASILPDHSVPKPTLTNRCAPISIEGAEAFSAPLTGWRNRGPKRTTDLPALDREGLVASCSRGFDTRSGSARMIERAAGKADTSGSERPPLHERRCTVVLESDSPRLIPPKVDCVCFTSASGTKRKLIQRPLMSVTGG